MPKPTTPRFRPSDLLPWADPHIRSLVEQLQDEVREENAAMRRNTAEAPASNRWAELEERFALDETLGA